MTSALILGESPVALWSLNSHERLRRQFGQVGDVRVVESLSEVESAGTVLIVRADYLFEVRTLTRLLERGEGYLRCPTDGRLAAGVVAAAAAVEAAAVLRGEQDGADLSAPIIEPDDLEGFDQHLRKAEAPMLEPISEANRHALEARLYGGAYKGITDIVTKFLWPRPAKRVVGWCAARRITPNMVTSVGLTMVVIACFAFLEGYYWVGLGAGWLMTFLDTVDGKLARVTVKSSKFGHYLDHVTDIVHPPFWYIFWGMSLTPFAPVLGFGQVDLYWMIGIGYVGGRLIEAAFHLLGDSSIFSWRPFDAYFRLITGRRNPCLIILTAALALGSPYWGFVAVAFWTAGTTLVLAVRLLQGALHRATHGPLKSWLADTGHARTEHPRAYLTFSSTKSAYSAG